MNNQIMELTKKVLEANEAGTPYDYTLYTGPGFFEVKVQTCLSGIGFSSVNLMIAEWNFTKSRSMEEELEYAIATMTNINRYGLLDAYRLNLAEQMLIKLSDHPKVNGADVLEHFNIDLSIGEALENGPTPKAV